MISVSIVVTAIEEVFILILPPHDKLVLTYYFGKNASQKPSLSVSIELFKNIKH